VAGISFRDVHGIADELGVDVQTVRRWIQSGKLRAFKPGKEYRVREADLEEFLAAREVRPKGPAPSPLEPSLLNGLENERRASPVFADALITTAEWLASLEPPQSLADVLKRFGFLEVLDSLAEPLDVLANAPARWERFPLDERMEIGRAALALHDTARRVLDENNDYLERRREDREASREAAAMREKMRAWNQRRSA